MPGFGIPLGKRDNGENFKDGNGRLVNAVLADGLDPDPEERDAAWDISDGSDHDGGLMAQAIAVGIQRADETDGVIILTAIIP